MTAFSLLDSGLQNMLSYQHEVFLKAAYFVGMLVFSIIYLYYFRPKREKTPFFSVVLVRLMMDGLSTVYLITMPLLLFQFAPEYSGYDFIYVYFILYMITLSLYLLLLIVDMFRYGIPYMMRKGDLKLNDPYTKLAYQKIDRWFKNGFR